MIRSFVITKARSSSWQGHKIRRTVLVRAFMPHEDDTNMVEWHKMRVIDLRKELKLRNMPNHGLKKDLIQRLNAVTSPFPSLDPQRTYILRIKGLSSTAWNGTGVGVCLIDITEPNAAQWTARKFLQGNRSVFEAEYSALIVGLQYAVQLGVRKVILELDHDVISNQIEGIFEVQKQSLKPLYSNVMGIRQSLDELHVKCISVAENQVAHEMAAKALATGRGGIGTVQDPMEGVLQGRDTKRFIQNPALDVKLAPGVHAIDPKRTYLLQFDGGSRGNPKGYAGAGMVIFDSVHEPRHEVWCGWQYLDTMSNNQAEYSALVKGLECAKSLGITRIVVEGDSDLIVKQVKGVYRVKDPNLKILWGKANGIIRNFDSFEIRHIRRSFNKRADWLANFAMDNKNVGGFDQLNG